MPTKFTTCQQAPLIVGRCVTSANNCTWFKITFSSDEKINSIQEKKISRYIMQISLLYNVEHLDRRPLVKAVHAVAVGGHLEDAVDVVVGDDLAAVVAEVAHEPE